MYLLLPVFLSLFHREDYREGNLKKQGPILIIIFRAFYITRGLCIRSKIFFIQDRKLINLYHADFEI